MSWCRKCRLWLRYICHLVMRGAAGDSGALVHPHLFVSLVTKFPGANGSQNQSLRQHPLNITAYDLCYLFIFLMLLFIILIIRKMHVLDRKLQNKQKRNKDVKIH